MPTGLSTLPALSSGESSPHTAVPHFLWLLSVQHVMWTQTLIKASKAEKPVSTAQLLSRESPDSGIRTAAKKFASTHSWKRPLEAAAPITESYSGNLSTGHLGFWWALCHKHQEVTLRHRRGTICSTRLSISCYSCSTRFHSLIRKCLNSPIFNLLMIFLVKYVIRNLSIFKKAVKLYEHSSLSLSREWKLPLLCS